MIQELPVFEAWRDRKNLKIYASLAPKIPITLEKATDQAMSDADAVYLGTDKTGKEFWLSGWSKVYTRKLNWIEKLRRKLS